MPSRAAWAALLTLTGAAATSAAELTSPMVNRAVYRDGAVERSSRRFGDWTLVCDEIKALHQRFCSLRTAGDAIRADVSTGDDGKPAVLLHLPVAVSLAYGIRVASAESSGLRGVAAGRKGAPRDGRRVGIASCTDRDCIALWSLAPAEIAALNGGRGLGLTYCMAGTAELEFANDLKAGSCAHQAGDRLSGTGFQAAIQASIE